MVIVKRVLGAQSLMNYFLRLEKHTHRQTENTEQLLNQGTMRHKMNGIQVAEATATGYVHFPVTWANMLVCMTTPCMSMIVSKEGALTGGL